MLLNCALSHRWGIDHFTHLFTGICQNLNYTEAKVIVVNPLYVELLLQSNIKRVAPCLCKLPTSTHSILHFTMRIRIKLKIGVKNRVRVGIVF